MGKTEAVRKNKPGYRRGKRRPYVSRNQGKGS